MANDVIPESHDLANKPLVEAMFELRWKTDEHPSKGQTAFRLLFGRYYDRVRGTYPEVEDLPASQVPEALTPHIVRHRFRSGPNQWPLTQIGAGILTVNETEKYKWDPFREKIGGSLTALFESYPTDISPFAPTQVELRYINLLPFDVWNGGITDFIANNLHTTISLDEKLFDGPRDTSRETGLDFSMSLRLKKPEGIGTLMFGTGESDNKTGILWQIIIRTHPRSVPQSCDDIIKWTDDAHDVVDRWFFTLARGSLMDSFDREPK